jgi:hypothetical protein
MDEGEIVRLGVLPAGAARHRKPSSPPVLLLRAKADSPHFATFGFSGENNVSRVGAARHGGDAPPTAAPGWAART